MPGVFSIAKIAMRRDQGKSTQHSVKESSNIHHKATRDSTSTNSSIRDTPTSDSDECNETDCVVGVAIDGTTYIANARHTAVFDYQHNVAAFAAGKYTSSATEPACASLVYVGFESYMHIYYDLGMTSLAVPSLLDMVAPEVQKFETQLHMELNEVETRELLRLCLYDTDNTEVPTSEDDQLLRKLKERGLLRLISQAKLES